MSENDTGLYTYLKYLPSALQIPTDSTFTMECDGKTVLIKVLDCLWPISILDFNNEFVGTNLKRQSYNTIGKMLVKEDDEVSYAIDSNNINTTEIFRTPYTRIIIKFETQSSGENAKVAENAFNRFYLWYQILSEDTFALSHEGIQLLSRFSFHNFTTFSEEELKLSATDRLNLTKEIELGLKQITISAYNIKNRYKPEFKTFVRDSLLNINLDNVPSFVSETMNNAKRQLSFYKNFKYALLECFFVVEYLVFNYVTTRKLNKGISNSKLKEFTKDIGISYMLNVELLLLTDNITDELKNLITELNIIRKRRNDIVHNGKSITEEEASHAYRTTRDLLVYLQINK